MRQHGYRTPAYAITSDLPNNNWQIVAHALVGGGAQNLEAAEWCAIEWDASLNQNWFKIGEFALQANRGAKTQN
jgi:transcription elongation factor